MLRIFKNYNPYIVLLLLLGTIVLKFHYLVYPSSVIVLEHQGIWDFLTSQLQWQGNFPVFFTLIAILNLVGQSLFLNKIVLQAQLFPFKSYLPALSFLMISNLIPDWNYLSIYLLSNWFVLGLLNSIVKLGYVEDARLLIINSGLMVGLATLMVASNVFLLLILITSMLLLRTFKLSEWLLLLMGLLLPYYFTLSVLYLTDELHLFSQLFALDLMEMPELKTYEWRSIWLPIGFITVFSLLGLWVLHTKSAKMLIQVKKLWMLIISSVLIITLGGFFNVSDGFYAWITALLPLSIIFTMVWYADYKKWLMELLFLMALSITLYIQWI